MPQAYLETGLAFLEGLALIASPCIWPILPLVLSASVSGGRRRPFGVITGFVLSFAAFAWASRWLIDALNIDLDYIKYASLGLLAFFGLVLLSSSLSERFASWTRSTADIAARVPGNGSGGYWSGAAIGALIGLVWTPCAGPVLAAVLVQIIRQPDDLSGLVILIAFALGTAVPMSIIALTGRAAVTKFGFVRNHAAALRKSIGVIILASVAYLASGVDLPTLIQQQSAQTQSDPTPLTQGGDTMKPQRKTSATVLAAPAQAVQPPRLIRELTFPYPAPPLKLGGIWINSPPLTMEGLRGKVVLIDFWTYSCINCLRTLPFITQWDEKYRDKGLVIIGVHAPEFAFEKDADNVRKAVVRYNIHYPVMQDNNLDTWSLYNNRYWPAHYLIDRDGTVVYTHFGEGEYDVTESNIRTLLGPAADMPAQGKAPEASSSALGQTPETYLGWARAESMANEEQVRHDKPIDYVATNALDTNAWALSGRWIVDQEKITSAGDDETLRLAFRSRRVFLVLGSQTGKPVTATVTLNGSPLGPNAGKDAPSGVVSIHDNRLYELVDQGAFKPGLLEIHTSDSGLQAYAFTFGL